MGRKIISLVGQKFGRLTVREFVGQNKYGQSMWSCVCECGSTPTVQGARLRIGSTKSCGCFQKEHRVTHGHYRNGVRTKLMDIWKSMIRRHLNVDDPAYKNYGGRGIKVCSMWLDSFENFYRDMGDCPEGMWLDRIDNDGDYCKENCRWATREEQMNNKRTNNVIEFNGESRTIARWARHLNINNKTLWARLYKLNWTVERTLTTPVRTK